jgi:RimJ/RimL family protein N-acetyltransferase
MELRDYMIVLRPWREDDADAVHAACQDAKIRRWIPIIPRPYTHDDARTFVTGRHGPGGHQLAIEREGVSPGRSG